MKMKNILFALIASTVTSSVLALDPMPTEAGFAGSLALGAAGGKVESNFLARILGIDLSNATIYSLSSPDDTKIISPTFDYNIGYTFASKKTRVSLASAAETSIDFSSNTTLALRHDFDSVGHLELAALAPPLARVDVWEDPYSTGQKRSRTERSSSGVRATWDKILGSNFELIATFKKKDIDDEHSGQSLGLSATEEKLLKRGGDITVAELGYAFVLGGGKNMIRPSIAYVDYDLDGAAMAQDGYRIGVAHMYNGRDFMWLNRALYESLDGDKVNPIFNKTNNADVYIFASELRFPEPLGWDKWVATTGIQWGENDAEIDFNKGSTLLFVARVVRTF
jgi:hypothetical protein